jgi:hypothetical protein
MVRAPNPAGAPLAVLPPPPTPLLPRLLSSQAVKYMTDAKLNASAITLVLFISILWLMSYLTSGRDYDLQHFVIHGDFHY